VTLADDTPGWGLLAVKPAALATHRWIVGQ
jgi:hypothetical protein